MKISTLWTLKRAVRVAAAALAPLAFSQPLQALDLNTNLVVNPGAESGPGASDFSSVATLPGWTTTSNFTPVQYAAGTSAGQDLLATSPGPTDRGSNYFAGGPSNAQASASQVIDLSSLSAAIDTHSVDATLGGWLGGFSSQDDQMTLTANFLNASSKSLSSLQIGPVTEAERNSQSALVFESTEGVIPVGTRSVDLLLNSVRFEGSYDDGYADNLSFSVNPVPEPSGLMLVGLGLAALLGVLGFRRSAVLRLQAQ